MGSDVPFPMTLPRELCCQASIDRTEFLNTIEDAALQPLGYGLEFNFFFFFLFYKRQILNCFKLEEFSGDNL